MSSTLIHIYLGSAIVTTALVFLASHRVSDRSVPARFGLSFAAGALWPLVVLGLLEFGSFVAYTKVADSDEEPLTVDA